MPKRTTQHKRLLRTARVGLTALFNDQETVLDTTPLLTQRTIQDTANENLTKFKKIKYLK